MTPSCRRLSASARTTVWRGARVMLLAAAIGLGGWQAAQFDWSTAGRTLDAALWSHALKERPTATNLLSAAPMWREREGASGDTIVERIDRTPKAEAKVAVLDEVSGQAIPAPVLAKEAAGRNGMASQVEPASFNGLAAGDRLTIATTGGDVYTFEVVASREDASDDGNFAIRVMAPDGDYAAVLYAVRPVAPQAPAARQQQDL